ncbi:hypothetical protein LTR04_002105 [Oleoguttula sp. CCFEE 6159]|nr:hypothetical protein LTR04_002105 [Oleoguttula sp. CCFEE 6159]
MPPVAENPQSPNAIPPRTSSAAALNGHSPQRDSILREDGKTTGKGKRPLSQPLPAAHAYLQASLQSQPHTHTYPPPLSPPPPDPLGKIDSEVIYRDGKSWSPDKEKILFGPYDYMFNHPGKDIRAQLISAFNAWLQVPKESLAIITKVVGMLHTSSLLIDDVEDSSLLRRGVPVAHSIFGVAQTINSANYIYFCALQELLKLNNPEAIRIYTEELLNLHRGQGMDLYWRDTLTCPTEADYLEMVGNKTGGLFRLAVKLMQAESSITNPTACSSVPSPRNGDDAQPGASSADPSSGRSATHPLQSNPAAPPTDCVPLVNTIGLLFQILDDYKNLASPTLHAQKGLCEDLTEGKFSFPVIHAIRADASSQILVNILRQKTHDAAVKRYAVDYMERVGSFAYTRKVLRELGRRALRETEALDAGRGRGDGVRRILELMRVEQPASQHGVANAASGTGL